MTDVTQTQRLVLRLQELAMHNPGKVVCLTVVFDKAGNPVAWWPQVLATAEGVQKVEITTKP